MKYSSRLHLTAAAAAVFAALAASSSVAVAAEETVSTETVKVTAARVEQELMDVNMSVSVITADDIRKSEARSVGELLKDIPGVRINNDGGQGIKRVSIRGEDTFRTLVMIDGQKISEQKSMSGSPMLIDPSQIERIEVIKGPTSVLYGSDAIGGAINIITKKGGTKAVQGEVSAGMDNSSNGKSVAASIYGAQNGWHYRLGAAYEKGDELETPAGKMENTGFDSKSANLFLAYDINDKAQVGLTVDHHDLAFRSGSVTYAKDDFFVDVPDWKRTKVALFSEVKDINDYLTRVRADVFYQKNKKKMQNFVNTPSEIDIGTKQVIGFDPSSGPIYEFVKTGTTTTDVKLDNHAENDLDQYGISLQTDWQLGDNHYLITGYEYGMDRLDANSNSLIQPLDYVWIKSSKDYKGDAQSHALFAAFESSFGDVTFNYGARYTYVGTHMDAISSSKSVRPLVDPDGYRADKAAWEASHGGQADPSLTGGVFSGSDDEPSSKNNHNDRVVFNAGVLYNGIENVTLRASWAQGFRAPLLQERYIDTTMGGSDTLANPNLKPETSNNFEIGTRYLSHALTVDAAMFLSLADDYIATTPTGTSGQYQYNNIAKAKTYGLELATSLRLGSSGFEPYANVTVMRRQFENGSGFKTYKTGTPTLWAQYGLRWNGEHDGLRLMSDLYAHSQTAAKYDDGKDENSSSYRLGGATTLNWTAGVAFGPEKQYGFNVGLYNIFDKKYQDATSIYEPGRYFSVKMSARF